MISVGEFCSAFELEQIYMPPDIAEFAISSADMNRPGLQLSGFYSHFAHDRLQIIGRAEMTYMQEMAPGLLAERLDMYMSFRPPCIVVCRGMDYPPEMVASARRYGVPLLRTTAVTTRFAAMASTYLNGVLAPQMTCSGVLLDVDGVGVLLTGESGIGKSETALELVKRGHMLVADDVVEMRRVSDNRVIGNAPATVRNFMEIRGVGLIDVRAMYGISSVSSSKSIDLNIHMQLWEENRRYDRMGAGEDYTDLLGVRVRRLLIPVRPGRNLAITVEAAAKDYLLRRQGYNAAQEIEKRMMEQYINAMEGERKD